MSETNGGNPLITSKTIERTWGGLPGFVLFFPVSIALSGNMSQEREKTIGLAAKEKASMLLDFRTRLVSDILTDAPYMIELDALPKLKDQKAERAIKAENETRAGKPDAKPVSDEEAKRFYKDTVLTDEDIRRAGVSLPGWNEIPAEKTGLYDRAYAFFSKEENGRRLWAMVIEDVVAAYWDWATPNPTTSVSAFTQDTRATSIKN